MLGYELLGSGLAIVIWLTATSPKILRATRWHPVRMALRVIIVVPGGVLYAIGGVYLLVEILR